MRAAARWYQETAARRRRAGRWESAAPRGGSMLTNRSTARRRGIRMTQQSAKILLYLMIGRRESRCVPHWANAAADLPDLEIFYVPRNRRCWWLSMPVVLIC